MNETFFFHTHHSEPKEQTLLEIKNTDSRPRRRVLKTKLWLKLHSPMKAKVSEPCSFSEDMFTQDFVLSVSTAHAPCGSIFLGRVGCDSSPLPTHGVVGICRAHLNHNTEE